jgi:hypothetical protein
MRQFVVVMLWLLVGLACAQQGAWVRLDAEALETTPSRADEFYTRRTQVAANRAEWHSTSIRGIDTAHAPQNLHAVYTWDTPPARVACGEQVQVSMQQQVIAADTGGYGTALRTRVRRVGTRNGVVSVLYADGRSAARAGLGHQRDGGNVSIVHTVAFPDVCRLGQDMYLDVYVTDASHVGQAGRRYYYAWQETTPTQVTLQLSTEQLSTEQLPTEQLPTEQLPIEALAQLDALVAHLQASGAATISVTLESSGAFHPEAPAALEALLEQLGIVAEVRWE